jgi:Sec7-like guanine-nucleotide exchange factor
MNSGKYSKPIRKEIQSLAGKALENELHDALLTLLEKIDNWKSGKISSISLTEEIRVFSTQKAKEICKLYDYQNEDFSVARAMSKGLLNTEAISPGVTEELKKLIDGFKG